MGQLSCNKICRTSLLLLILLTTALPAQGQQPKGPGQMMEEGVRHFLEALDLILGMIPTYEEPEILPNGDIIIRRKKDTPDIPRQQDDTDGEAHT